MTRLLFPLTLMGGCFHAVTSSTCETLDLQEVEDTEVTAAGSAADLLARVAVDQRMLAVWATGEATEADVFLGRGTGSATFIEQTEASETTRSFGIGGGSNDMLVRCPNALRVPLIGEVLSIDGQLEVFASGLVATDGPNEAWLRVSLDGAFDDAVLPEGEVASADYTNKSTFLNADFDELGMVDGSAGWNGELETEDTSSSRAERLLELRPLGLDEP